MGFAMTQTKFALIQEVIAELRRLGSGQPADADDLAFVEPRIAPIVDDLGLGVLELGGRETTRVIDAALHDGLGVHLVDQVGHVVGQPRPGGRDLGLDVLLAAGGVGHGASFAVSRTFSLCQPPAPRAPPERVTTVSRHDPKLSGMSKLAVGDVAPAFTAGSDCR